MRKEWVSQATWQQERLAHRISLCRLFATKAGLRYLYLALRWALACRWLGLFDLPSPLRRLSMPAGPLPSQSPCSKRQRRLWEELLKVHLKYRVVRRLRRVTIYAAQMCNSCAIMNIDNTVSIGWTFRTTMRTDHRVSAALLDCIRQFLQAHFHDLSR